MKNYNTDQSCTIDGRYGLWRAAVAALACQETTANSRSWYTYILGVVFIQFDWATRAALSANILRSDSALINQANGFNMFSLQIIFGQTSRSWWRWWLISVWSLSFAIHCLHTSRATHSAQPFIFHFRLISAVCVPRNNWAINSNFQFNYHSFVGRNRCSSYMKLSFDRRDKRQNFN